MIGSIAKGGQLAQLADGRRALRQPLDEWRVVLVVELHRTGAGGDRPGGIELDTGADELEIVEVTAVVGPGDQRQPATEHVPTEHRLASEIADRLPQRDIGRRSEDRERARGGTRRSGRTVARDVFPTCTHLAADSSAATSANIRGTNDPPRYSWAT